MQLGHENATQQSMQHDTLDARQATMLQRKVLTLLDPWTSSLRRGHASIFCIVPMLNG